MVARRWSFRSSTSRMVNMISMLPILSLMLSEAGASLMGQRARCSVPEPWAPDPAGRGLLRCSGLWCGGRQESQRSQVDFHRQQMLAGLQVLLVVRTGAGEQPRVDLVDVVAAAHDGAELLAILGEGDGAALGQFEALPHALHAHGDIAAVGEGREGIGRLHAGLLPAQRGRVFVAGEIRNGVGLCGRAVDVIRSLPCLTPFVVIRGLMLELMSPRGARDLGRSAWTRARRFFMPWSSVRMTTTGLPSCSMHWIMCAVPGDCPSQHATRTSPAWAIWWFRRMPADLPKRSHSARKS